MKVLIAVTGGIGSGKSSLMGKYRKLGYTTFDMDKLVKEVYQRPIGKAFVQDEHPQSLKRDGVDFNLWREILFNTEHKDYDSDRLGRTEKFFAHEAFKMLTNLTYDLNETVYVECSMFFEHIKKGILDDSIFDYTINVHCPEYIRLDRACFRDRSDPDLIKAKMKNQVGDDERKKLADFTINNSGQDEDDLWIGIYMASKFHREYTLRKSNER